MKVLFVAYIKLIQINVADNLLWKMRIFVGMAY